MLGIYAVPGRSDQGFTLIEMSIVLVIIGLIIGGILKGQEIIESSRQKNVITQIDAVRAAINTFADKYNALPGDFLLADTRLSANVANGGGDGLIGDTSAALNAAPRGGESSGFFDHLNAAELLSGTTIGNTSVAPTGFGDGDPLPAVAIPGAGMSLQYGLHELDTDARRTTHWLRIHKDATAALASTAAGGAFTGKNLGQIDLKIDDGNGERGSTRHLDNNTTCIAADGVYASLQTSQVCVGYFELLQ